MHDERTLAESDFPQFGARARCWHRFENELRRWLATPDGRFATWTARRCLDAPPDVRPSSAPSSGTPRIPR
jgi:hypothetical protein